MNSPKAKPPLPRWTPAWFIQGIRWRVQARYRKGLWWVRREMRHVRRFRRQVTRIVRKTLLQTRSLLALRRSLSPKALLHTIRTGRDLNGPETTEALCRLAIGDAAAKALRPRHHRKLRRLVHRPLDAARNATDLVATLESPTRWKRATRKRISEARLVQLEITEPGGPLDLLRTVLPVLLSGRPIVDSGNFGRWQSSIESARHLTETERMAVANNQLRSLFFSDKDEECWPRIGVIMSTNRPEFLGPAIEMMQAQQLVQVELRIGLHGIDVPGDLGPVTGGAIVDSELLHCDTAMLFGDVLQDLTLRTTTQFVSKWDDDDRYGPHHLIDLWLGALLSGAAIVGKAAEFVHLDGRNAVVRRRGGPLHSATRFLAGGTLMIKKGALETVGGWGSVPRQVDQELIGRLEKGGFTTFRIHGQEFVLTRHDGGHTWDAADSYFMDAADSGWGLTGLARAGTASNDEHAPPSPASATPSQEKSISVCVPNRNNHSSMRRLELVADSFNGVGEILVADDRSEPPLAISSPSDVLQVVPVPIGDGFGAGRSRRAAAAGARGDVLFFMDADIHATQLAIDAVASLHQAGAGVVHAALEFTDITSDAATGLIESTGVDGFERSLTRQVIPGQSWRELHWARSADLADPRSASFRACVGGFVSIDRSIYDAIGGFRDVPVRGVEDVEFGYRVQLSGCDQRLYRSGGLVHLGQRTFANELDETETLAREVELARYVPIWSRTLGERSETLTATTQNDLVPFIALRDEVIAAAANTTHGKATAVSTAVSWAALDAPFCFALDAVQASIIEHLPQIFRLFRESACGEVSVLHEGEQVARILALWAVNRQRTLRGQSPLLDSDELARSINEVRAHANDVRNGHGLRFITT